MFLSYVELNALKEALNQVPPALHVDVIKGQAACENVIVCCHGYGGNYTIANVIKCSGATGQHLVGFNFPDHDIGQRSIPPLRTTFGTFAELKPLLLILKRIVIDLKSDQVSLYGFSAGGGAVVNTIAVLNNVLYNKELFKIGIDVSDKKQILEALEKGVVLLDAPLKSVEEVIENCEDSFENRILAARYKMNNLRPIDSLEKWKGLKLNVILFFQNPDEMLSNEEDELFIERLKKSNHEGKNIIIKKNEEGHCGYHISLWKALRDLQL